MDFSALRFSVVQSVFEARTQLRFEPVGVRSVPKIKGKARPQAGQRQPSSVVRPCARLPHRRGRASGALGPRSPLAGGDLRGQGAAKPRDPAVDLRDARTRGGAQVAVELVCPRAALACPVGRRDGTGELRGRVLHEHTNEKGLSFFYHDLGMPLFALTAYAKNEQDDLSQQDRNDFRQLTSLLVGEFKRRKQ